MLPTAVELSNLKRGDHVVICAADEFFAFVDGWRGVVDGFNNGLVVVLCDRADGVKTLFVPPAQVRLSIGSAPYRLPAAPFPRA